MMLSARKIAQGECRPFGYGFSYYSAYSDHIIAYPFPFHWIARWARSFWWWATSPTKKLDELSRSYDMGRNSCRIFEQEQQSRDYTRGFEDGKKALANELTKQYEARFGRKLF